jgi:uncharacterized protein YceK
MLSGCASVRYTFWPEEPQKDSLIYVGTRMNYWHLTNYDGGDGARTLGYFIAWPFMLVSLPFSVVADTLLLPYTISHPQKGSGDAQPTVPADVPASRGRG